MEEKVRRRGRPRAYDPDQVLDRAAEIFWARGYDATSLDDLSQAMGMGRPSIYNAFGDKEQLFLKVLERYRDTVGLRPLRAMEGVGDVADALEAYFREVIAYTTEADAHLGCLLGSVAVAATPPSVRTFLQSNLAWLEGRLAERLAEAVADGQLPADYPVARGARQAINGLLAIAVHARMGIPPEELIEDARAGMDAVFGVAHR